VELGHAPTWPRREPRIAPVEHLRESLSELRRLGFLSPSVEGGTASISYGSRTREIAERWHIEVPPIDGTYAPEVDGEPGAW